MAPLFSSMKQSSSKQRKRDPHSKIWRKPNEDWNLRITFLQKIGFDKIFELFFPSSSAYFFQFYAPVFYLIERPKTKKKKEERRKYKKIILSSIWRRILLSIIFSNNNQYLDFSFQHHVHSSYFFHFLKMKNKFHVWIDMHFSCY